MYYVGDTGSNKLLITSNKSSGKTYYINIKSNMFKNSAAYK